MGLDHHCRVSSFSVDLIKNEKISIDWKLASLSSWWHDIEDKDGQINDLLIFHLNKENLEKKIIDEITKAIKEHSFFNQKQTSLLSKILFDADKSEYISPSRLLFFSELVKSKSIDKMKADKYINLWFERLKTLKQRLHFNYTKEYYKNNISYANEIMKELYDNG